jgi:type IV secretion system protein VirB9
LNQQAATIAADAAVTGSRTVPYHAREVVSVRAKVRFTTLIALPEGEEIVEATCGDKEFWTVHARGALAYVKPAKPGSETNLNLTTASGQVYAFRLSEVSSSKDLEPDLAVYLEADAPSTFAPTGPSPKFVAAEQLEDVRAELALAKADLARTTTGAAAQIDREVTAFRTAYPLGLRFPYRFRADVAPMFVHAMFHDDHVTYIQLQNRATPRELPALYELKDGAANLVSFEVRGNTYIVPKILDTGYLAIGKARWLYARVDAE